MEIIHPEVCPNCGVKLMPYHNIIKEPDEVEVKRLVSENGVLSKITDGVYKKENCPHYYNLLKTKDIKENIILICYEDATAWLPIYEKALNNYELSVFASHCIGVMAK